MKRANAAIAIGRRRTLAYSALVGDGILRDILAPTRTSTWYAGPAGTDKPRSNKKELDRFADAAVSTFVSGYGVGDTASPRRAKSAPP